MESKPLVIVEDLNQRSLDLFDEVMKAYLLNYDEHGFNYKDTKLYNLITEYGKMNRKFGQQDIDKKVD